MVALVKSMQSETHDLTYVLHFMFPWLCTSFVPLEAARGGLGVLGAAWAGWPLHSRGLVGSGFVYSAVHVKTMSKRVSLESINFLPHELCQAGGPVTANQRLGAHVRAWSLTSAACRTTPHPQYPSVVHAVAC